MRYRALDANEDYAFGDNTVFLQDTPATVAQAILTRMRLYTEEWFLDSREGLDKSMILGYGTQGTRDLVIKNRIRNTPGVANIVSYSSYVDENRAFWVTAVVDTDYGQTTVEAKF